MQYLIDQFADTIQAAGSADEPLIIRSGGTKDFYGGRVAPLALADDLAARVASACR